MHGPIREKMAQGFQVELPIRFVQVCPRQMTETLPQADQPAERSRGHQQ